MIAAGAQWPEPQFDQAAACIKAIACPLRLSIVFLLLQGELCVQDIARQVSSSQPNVSQHLNRLANQQVVRSRKDSNRVLYSIANPQLLAVLELIGEWQLGQTRFLHKQVSK